MRLLGAASIQSYRWDLVFLHGSLLADEDARIAALAPTAANMLDELRTERDLYERAEEADIVASAVRVRRDSKLDRIVITFGGIARAISDVVYKRFFARLSPSRVAKAALDDEIFEVKQMLGHFGAMPSDDALRVAHEASVRDSLRALEAAKTAEESADVALTVASARLTTFKARVDRQRTEVYGQLVTLTGDKSVADTYFRPTTAAPKGGDTPPPPPSGDSGGPQES